MKKKNILLRILKISGITFGAIVLLLFFMPILFPGTIAEEVKAFANRKLKGELNFKEANLSFFNHFPSLTLTLTDFSLKGSAPYQDKTLVASKEVAFGINLKSLIFEGDVNIDQIFISKAEMHVLVNAKGEANYNVYVSDAKEVKKDSSSTSLRLEKIVIEDSHLVYNDQSAKMLIDARGFNYKGKGDLDQAIFDLKTKMQIDSFDFTFNGEEYLKNKKVNADLLTQINTNSLSFLFQQNNLIINKLPIDFIGKLDFLKSGYDIDFKVQSDDSDLHDVFTALPPHYVKWLEKTKLEGRTDLLLTFKGRYNVAENKKPDLAFKMKVRDGFVAYNEADIPASNIYLNFETRLPALNTNNLNVKVDSLFFNLGKDYFSGIVETVGMESPKVKAKIKSQLDLGKLHRAIGMQNMDFKGMLKADITANGTFDRQKHLFPVTKGNLVLQNGVLKLKNTNFDLIGSKFNMEATYGSLNPQKAAFNYKIKAENFDVKKAYTEIKMFRDMASAAENAEGIVSVDYKIAGHLDGNMQPIYPSLKGSGVLSVRDVKMKGFKLFNTVSKKTGKEGIKDPNLKEIDIATSVKNNIMNIERFKFKVAGFRPRIEGQTSLDGKLNLKMRLGLPPLGIIGIPLKITGTSENPKIKIGKQTEDLEASEYEAVANDTITKTNP